MSNTLPDSPSSRAEQYLARIVENIENGNNANQSILLDVTLSNQGFVADAKATGDAISALHYDTDSTLTLEGKAADAKAAGDAIAAIHYEIDDTLSVPNKAADAKAAGDAISALHYEIDDSLTQVNKAADAKAAGDAIRALDTTTDSTLQIQNKRADAKATGDSLSEIAEKILFLETGNRYRGFTPEQAYEIVTDGSASRYFDIGEQIISTWNDGTNEYECPWDIVAIRDVVNANGNTVPGMILQSHYVFPGIQFDASEAAYVCPTALSPGTYNIGIGTTWGSKCVAGSYYSFTTTVEIPAGGQIVFSRGGNNIYIWAAPDQADTTWVCYTFSSNASTTPLETLTLTKEQSGTSLGSLASNVKYGISGINNLQRAAYGYNRYSQSAVRQYLNSNAAVGSWWEPKNMFDRPPQQLSSTRGFKAGLPSDFLSVVNPIRVTTALNTVSDSDIGTQETVTDTFFLPSLEEEYVVPQLADVEGSYFPYWKDRLYLNSPQLIYQSAQVTNANANHIRYLISNHSSAQNVRLRSADRGNALSTWYVSTAGNVYGYGGATNSSALAPACAVCQSS